MVVDRPHPRTAFEEALDSGVSLARRLDVYAHRIAQSAPEVALAYDRLVARLVKSGAGTNAPIPGDIMPPFALPDDTGRLVSLNELIAGGPLILSLNRGHWCGFCRLELTHLAEHQAEVESLGARVASITPDRRPYTARLKSEHGLRFPVLSDIDNSYALSLGLLVWLGPEIRDILLTRGRDLSRFQGNEGWLVPIPATFVIGQSGRVLARFIDSDFRRRMTMEEILSALRHPSGPL